MKNIYDILAGMGIEIPEDKKETFNKEVSENYKTIAEVENLKTKLATAEADRDTYKNKYDTDIAARDEDLATLKSQLEEAGQSKEKLATLQQTLADTQSKYETEKADWEKQLADQQYDFAVTEATRDIQFSSKAARKVFMDELKANPLQMKDKAILGFNDYVDAYREANPDSFIANDDDNNGGDNEPPVFSGRSGGNNGQDNNPPETKPVPALW